MPLDTTLVSGALPGQTGRQTPEGFDAVMFSFSRLIATTALAFALFASLPSAASAAPITYEFKTVLGATDPWGTGSFTFDDSLLSATQVTQADLSAFTYSDPIINPTSGTPFTLANLASFHFVFHQAFSFVASSNGNQISFVGGPATPGQTAAGQSTNYFAGTYQVSRLHFPTQGVPEQPAAVPEPTTMVLLGTGLAGLLARRLRRA